MDTHPPQSPVLPHARFYVLLSLAKQELHGYAIHAVANNMALNTLHLGEARTYATIKEMVRDGQLDEAGMMEAGKLGKPRMHYRLSPEGKVRLKDELKRMKHAYEIGDRTGLFNEDLPADIKRMINSWK
jgi:DNA-binding PadR family transcriptional regulator